MKSPLSRTAAALCLSFGLLANTAQASPVEFTLNVVFGAGPLAGQTASGSFTVGGAGCSASLCSGDFTPDNGGLLDFGITVDGVLFTDSMDTDLDSPLISLSNNALTYLSFYAGGALPWLSLSAFSFDGSMFASGYYTPEVGDTSYVADGGISATAIPEPATALLAALGLVGVAGASRRRRQSAVAAEE